MRGGKAEPAEQSINPCTKKKKTSGKETGRVTPASWSGRAVGREVGLERSMAG